MDMSGQVSTSISYVRSVVVQLKSPAQKIKTF